MIQQSDIEKLERYRKGHSNELETQYIYSLFSGNEENVEFKKYIFSEWKDCVKNCKEENHNIAYLLDRIHHKIHFDESKKKKTVVRRIYHWYSVLAAVFLIPLLIASVIWFAERTQEEILVVENPVTSTLFAPLGSRIKFSLPDGTKGWLNSGSSLEYNIPFSNNRQISILGEAWFDVAHDDTHPFEINAGDSKIKVLGTKFNLNAYPEDNYVEVVLEEGKVEFSVGGLSSSIEMKPDERLVFSDGVVNIGVADASKYAAWKEGKLVFRGDPMDEVARRIERWYNVQVELVDKDLEKDVIRGTFEDDSLKEVLQFLCMTSPISYRIVEREILDDGTFQKKKVLLYRKRM